MNPSLPAHQPLAAPLSDSDRRRGLRWRARRGLLENDLILKRFFDRHEASLSDEEVAAVEELMELTDNELLDLFLGRTQLQGAYDRENLRQLLERLRAA